MRHELGPAASPCDPRTLTRARAIWGRARADFAAAPAARDALLAKGFGFEVTGSDVWTAFSSTVAAADRKGREPENKKCALRIRQILDEAAADS